MLANAPIPLKRRAASAESFGRNLSVDNTSLSRAVSRRDNGISRGSTCGRNQTLKIVLITLVRVATMLVPIPASGGYAGDGVILMCAFLMGLVNAAFA